MSKIALESVLKTNSTMSIFSDETKVTSGRETVRCFSGGYEAYREAFGKERG